MIIDLHATTGDFVFMFAKVQTCRIVFRMVDLFLLDLSGQKIPPESPSDRVKTKGRQMFLLSRRRIPTGQTSR